MRKIYFEMKIRISTKGSNDIIDITGQISDIVKKSKIKDGICLISCPGSTIGLTTIEAEPNLLDDFKEFLENLVPSNKSYRHTIRPGERKTPLLILGQL